MKLVLKIIGGFLMSMGALWIGLIITALVIGYQSAPDYQPDPYAWTQDS